MPPGVHRIEREQARGWVIYWYAWRGGPNVFSAHGKTLAEVRAKEQAKLPELIARWSEVVRPRPMAGFISGLIADWRSSPEWQQKARSTRKHWSRHCDRIAETFGGTSLRAIQKKGARALIKRWHHSMSATPRTANYRLTVLTALFNWAIDEERMERNPAAGIRRLDEGKGRAEIVWTEDDLEKMCRLATPPLEWALRLMWHTGLRREDAVQLRWNEVDLDAGMIRRPTLKSRGRRIAYVPISDDLAVMLLGLGRNTLTVLYNTSGQPWASGDSLQSTFQGVRKRAGLTHLRIHDLRGTYATRGYADGLSDGEMERRMAWAPGQGAAMRDVYGNTELLAMADARRRA